MSNSLVGRTLGNYKVLDLLGRGGMASVYLGYQDAVDRRVAIKVLPPHPGLDPQFPDRFRNEARTIARLQHPHILPLYDYGSEDDILYLVMAYIEGGTLADRVIDGPLPLRDIERMLREIASALDYAHRQGVIHRDIKPANILLDTEGHALLGDFGIAKIAGGANLTGTGVVGTPAYMPPEQARGGEIDARADIYSLGVVVYQMLCGQPPYQADTLMQVLLKVMEEQPPDIMTLVKGLPPEVSDVINKVLAKDPDARYQTAAAFAEAFSRAIRSGGNDLPMIQSLPALVDSGATAHLVPAASSRISSKVSPVRTVNISTQTEQPQTIIVHQGISPILLLGGFALIAVVLVIAVILVLSNRDDTPNQVLFVPPIGLETFIPDGTLPAITINGTVVGEAVAALVPTEAALPTFGRLTYGTSAAPGDTASLQVSDLDPLGAGKVYAAWLMNTQNGEVWSVGEVPIDSLGTGTLTKTDSEGRLLPTIYNVVAISVEPAGEIGDAPTDIRYQGSVPTEVMTLLSQMLVASDEGFEGGSLLAGAISEAEVAEQHAGLAARATNVGGLHTHAEHTINILRGERVDYDGEGGGQNPGRGVGVYTFLQRIETLLDVAINAADTNRQLQSSGEYIRVCLTNTRQRADAMIVLEEQLLAAQDVASVQAQAAESSQISAGMIDGIDLNENGAVEPFEGECGLEQIHTFGLIIASLDITALPASAGNR